MEDTLSSLKFAKRAKTIKNKVKVNLKRSAAEYMKIINDLKEENNLLKAELEQYRSGNMERPSPSPMKETITVDASIESIASEPSIS